MFSQLLEQAGQFILTAQGGLEDPGGGAYSGSVGHLISATMQTAGIYAQAEILRNFNEYLTHLAALCYLCSFVGALLSMAAFGNYSRGIYFLVGPPLFMYMINTTYPVKGAIVQNGARVAKGSVADQMEFLKKYVQDVDNGGNGANVSFFFMIFDNLVSSIVQGTSQVILDTRDNEDLLLRARERVFNWLYYTRPDDPGFAKLAVVALRGECGDISRRYHELKKYRLDAKKRSVDDDNLTEIGKEQKVKYNEEKTKPRFNLDANLKEFLLSEPNTQEFFRDEKVSCEQIWYYLRLAAGGRAQKLMDPANFIKNGASDGATNWEKAFAEALKTAEADGTPAHELIAAYIIKNALRNTTHSSLTMGVFNRVPFNARRYTEIYEQGAGMHRFGGMFSLEYFARSIPYVQGMLLYLLAMSFPFFAVFLVMPGRATTFMVWCSLWVWVKSWDVGFAMVGVARKVFWQFLSAAPNRFAAENVTDANQVGSKLDWSKPDTLIALISDNDPLANQNTYYSTIAVLTLSVPLLTAHFCLGATNLYDVFKMNIDQTATRFGGQRRAEMQRFRGASPAEQKQAEEKAGAQVAGNMSALNSATNQGGGGAGGAGGAGPAGGAPAGGAPANGPPNGGGGRPPLPRP